MSVYAHTSLFHGYFFYVNVHNVDDTRVESVDIKVEVVAPDPDQNQETPEDKETYRRHGSKAAEGSRCQRGLPQF